MIHYLNTCAIRLVTVPYAIVPHTGKTYLQQHSKIKLAKKFLHRYLWLKFSGQLVREIKHINKNMRALWLYAGKSNIGDAIDGRVWSRTIASYWLHYRFAHATG